MFLKYNKKIYNIFKRDIYKYLNIYLNLILFTINYFNY